jgi:hypothetical protein
VTVRFAIDSWAPGIGSAFGGDDDLLQAEGPVDVSVEVGASDWAPRKPTADPVTDVRFVDGTIRTDAIVWITDDDTGATRQGRAVSVAAGSTRTNGQAVVESALVRRILLAPAGTPGLNTVHGTYELAVVAGDDEQALRQRSFEAMGQLETRAAGAGEPCELVVVDGPLRGKEHVPGAVGYVKSHRTSYLPPTVSDTVAALAPGERTPLFVAQTGWVRYSWYVRLPGANGHPWAGIVRCEASAERDLTQVITTADRTAVTLPRFASEPHKDVRAPQNLYPIAGLERHLKRLLGDPALLERALRAAAHSPR